MATIYHQVGIKTSLHNAFAAVATLNGISSWWTATSGEPVLNGELHFHFAEQCLSTKVTGFEKNVAIEWTVRGEEGEWLDTRICFNLERADNQIFINFEHNNWQSTTPMFSHCSTKWAVFLLSLKDYLETGKGKPFPQDIQINHF